MSDEDILQRSRLKRILVFDGQNPFPDGFPTTGAMRNVLVRMSALDAELDALAPSQETAFAQSKGTTVTLHQLLDAVHDDLVNLSLISQAVDDDHPELRDLFRLPDNERQQNWIDLAKAVPAKLGPHWQLFEDQGLEPNFLQDLEADVLAYEQAFAGRSGDRQSRSGDTADIEAKTDEGKKLVKKLAVYGKIRFTHNPTLWGKWVEASTLGDAIKAHRAQPA